MTTHGFSAEGCWPIHQENDFSENDFYDFKHGWLASAIRDIESGYRNLTGELASPRHSKVVPEALEALSFNLRQIYIRDTLEIISNPRFFKGSMFIPDYMTILSGIIEALKRDANKKDIPSETRETFYRQSAEKLEGIVSLVREKKPLSSEQLDIFKGFVDNLPSYHSAF